MLSYKEYKMLNESLYGAFNLGLKNPNAVGGIVSTSSINGTEAALEAEEAIEESKKAKKKMDCDDEKDEEEEESKEKDSDDKDSDDKDSDDKDSDDKDSDDKDSDDKDSDEEDSDEEEEGGLTAGQKKLPKALQDAIKKKNKTKKEWSEIVAEIEEMLEGEDSEEIRKGVELIKEGAKKKSCGCGPDCQCEKCKSKKKCGRYMNEEEQAWWTSVNSMIGSSDSKNFDGWTEVGEINQAVREEA